VATRAIVRHSPPESGLRWIFTGTLMAHGENPSETLIKPEARRWRRSCNDTVRKCVSPVTVKSEALVAVPPGVVAVILPVVAPDGTVAVILVEEFTVNDADTLLNLTEVVVKPAPLKFVPLMVREVPTGPDVGENELIVGLDGVVTSKLLSLVAVPPGVVTRIFPSVAPEGTVAVILVEEFTVNDADTLLNVTEVVVKPAPLKFDPLMVTDVPMGPEVGENELMVGAAGAVTSKLVALVPVPPGVVTRIFPSVAPEGTVAVILVEEFTVNDAETLLNVTEVVVKPVPLKFDPLMVTDVPVGPEVGENELMVGAGTEVTSKLVALVPVPPGVVTRIFPSVAPEGTVAVILVEEFTVNDAETLLNVTELVVKPLPLKLVPLMVTEVPTGPEVGENELMVGAGTEVVTAKLERLEPVPPDAVTLIGPEVAPDGTVAVILVEETTV
jgi:hypothetical protein